MNLTVRLSAITRTLAGLAAAVCLLLGPSCATVNPVTGRRAYNIYSLNDDVKLGQSVLASNTQQLREAGVPVNQDAQTLRKLEHMVRRIAAVSDLPDLPYTVTLYHTNLVNAAAAPGGAIMVFEGLWDPKDGLVRDDDELAAVLAHEIAHITCRHTTERLTQVTTAALLAETAAAVASSRSNEEWAQGIRAAFAVGTTLWLPSYSRRDEHEADRVGMFYMARAGYPPQAMVRIWERASQRPGTPQRASIFATHPSSRERLQNLQALLPEAERVYQESRGRAMVSDR